MTADAVGRRIGVYVCHCGGNISDYVDVQRVIDEVRGQPGVVVARRAMFTCSDATQQEIVDDIREQRLDGLVVASCSPKLHTNTFRDVARRAGLNPYQYTQVNIREQCSWAHTDDHEGATGKAIRLVRAGIARTVRTTPLEPLVVQTVPRALVVGGGITGLRTALGLAEIGLGVFLVEREPEVGGWMGRFGATYPHDRTGRELIAGLAARVRAHPAITVFTGAELVGKSGSFGNYEVTVRAGGGHDGQDGHGETIRMTVGSVVVATGFDAYRPTPGEFGYGTDGVLTLPEFKELLDGTSGPLEYGNRPVRSIAYIYCVGSRQGGEAGGGNEYCSRYCCTAAVHASLLVDAAGASVRQYHLYRDMRTYGRYELLFNRSRRQGSVYLTFPADDPPQVGAGGAGGRETPLPTGPDGAGYRLAVRVRDLLAGGEQVQLPVDLVVLVTGMVPRANEELTRLLRLPIGRDGFYNEIHPKLRPVETVVDGVYLCGACQSPKDATESVVSGLAAATQAGALLRRGSAHLDPLVATVRADDCRWCGGCADTCPYGAIGRTTVDGVERAWIDEARCKGCGGCAPVCERNAIDLRGYTDGQLRSMIDGLLEATP